MSANYYTIKCGVVGIVTLLILLSPCAHAQPVTEELNAISERGKFIADYDAACWKATDVVLAANPDRSKIRKYIARRTEDSWEVAFGKLNAEGTVFTIAHKWIDGRMVNEGLPSDDTGYYFQAARALEETQKELAKNDRSNRKHNTAVIPFGSDFYVYWYVGPTQKDIYPLGGDWEYLVSGQSGKILQRRQLHKSILDSKSSPEDVAGFHTHVLDDIPGATDVFFVLSRNPRIAEMVLTKEYVYKIHPDGSIWLLGTTKDVLGEEAK